MKSTDDEVKLSENIQRYESGTWFVTAAIWRSLCEHQYFDSYEIGIRDRSKPDAFWLLQNRDFNHQSVQDVANAITHLLGEGYEPEWLIDWFGRERS